MREDEYYEVPATDRSQPAERYPRNHVRYARWLAPLELLNRAHLRFQRGPLAMRDAILRELDAAAPYDALLGSPEERRQLRECVAAVHEGFDRNPYLSGVGRALVKQIQIGFLRARRAVLAHYDAHREFIEARGRVRAPLIITGPGRTGSTLLQRLLAEDPNTRSPHTFEMESPLPPLAAGADPMRDTRIEKSGAAFQQIRRVAPGLIEKLDESHRWEPTEFEESFIYMLAHHGLTVMSGPASGRAGFRAILSVDGKRCVLRYERLFFTMLDAHRPAPSHWTLKAPNYAPVFPLLFDEYPDARVVITHRNPLVTYPSGARLLETWNVAFDRDGTFDKHRFASMLEEFVSATMMVPLRYREDHPDRESQIFDCMYDELFADPVAMVRRIYERFDLEVTPEFEQRMRAYLEKNRQGKYGRHRYSLEEYGIDAERFCETYRDYMSTYGYDLASARRPRATSLGAVAS